MNINRKLKSLVVAGVVATGFCGLGATESAQAGTIDVQFIGASPSASFRYELDGNNRSTTAGVMNWRRTGGTHIGNPALGDFEAFCIEITQYANSGTYDAAGLNVAPNPGQFVTNPDPGFGGLGMGADKANQITYLWDQYYATARTTSSTAAAFQVAVWELVYDTDFDVTTISGSSTSGFRARQHMGSYDSFVTTTQAYLADVAANWSTYTPSFSLLAMSNDNYQDQVFFGADLPGQTVPVPASAWMGLVTLGGLAVGRKLRK